MLAKIFKYGPFEEVVIGSSLSALLYSFLKNTHFVFAKTILLEEVERFSPRFDVSRFGLENENISLKTLNGFEEFGNKKVDLWDKLYFDLSLKGKNLSSNICSSFMVQDNILRCFSQTTSFDIEFKKLSIFDPRNISGISNKEEDDDLAQVYDLFEISHFYENGIKLFDLDYLSMKCYTFKKEIGGAKFISHILSSYKTKKQELNKDDYHESNLAIILGSFLEKNFQQTKEFVKLHYKQRDRIASFVERRISPIFQPRVFDQPNIEFISFDENEIVEIYG